MNFRFKMDNICQYKMKEDEVGAGDVEWTGEMWNTNLMGRDLHHLVYSNCMVFSEPYFFTKFSFMKSLQGKIHWRIFFFKLSLFLRKHVVTCLEIETGFGWVIHTYYNSL
jgi:hypothetical protein